MRLSIVSENMSSVAADIYYGFDVNRCMRNRMEGPGATRAEILKAVWEVRVKTSNDKIGAGAPSMGGDKITTKVKLSVTAVRRAQKHKAGIGKQEKFVLLSGPCTS